MSEDNSPTRFQYAQDWATPSKTNQETMAADQQNRQATALDLSPLKRINSSKDIENETTDHNPTSDAAQELSEAIDVLIEEEWRKSRTGLSGSKAPEHMQGESSEPASSAPTKHLRWNATSSELIPLKAKYEMLKGKAKQEIITFEKAISRLNSMQDQFDKMETSLGRAQEQKELADADIKSADTAIELVKRRKHAAEETLEETSRLVKQLQEQKIKLQARSSEHLAAIHTSEAKKKALESQLRALENDFAKAEKRLNPPPTRSLEATQSLSIPTGNSTFEPRLHHLPESSTRPNLETSLNEPTTTAQSFQQRYSGDSVSQISYSQARQVPGLPSASKQAETSQVTRPLRSFQELLPWEQHIVRCGRQQTQRFGGTALGIRTEDFTDSFQGSAMARNERFVVIPKVSRRLKLCLFALYAQQRLRRQFLECRNAQGERELWVYFDRESQRPR